jgi:Glyoxalase-like domain
MHLPDHIVYAVPDFDQAIHDLEQKLGIRPVIGGRHLLRGTKNALVNLGNTCYLEILAADPENVTFDGPRWMGIDLITLPTITRWAMQTSKIEKDSLIIKMQNQELGTITEGERKTPEGETLRWKMTLPLPAPETDVIPFLIDWSASDFHPTDKLENGCLLQNITLYHPQPQMIETILENVSFNMKVFTAQAPKITIQILGKNGVVEL